MRVEYDAPLFLPSPLLPQGALEGEDWSLPRTRYGGEGDSLLSLAGLIGVGI